MEPNVSASPGDADNLARRNPNAPSDATAPSGGDAIAAKAKADAQAKGRTEFMAANLSTVRDASRSEQPTPISLPRLQPITAVTIGAVTTGDLTTTATTVQATTGIDLTVSPPGPERVEGASNPALAPKIKWHDVAPPSTGEIVVLVPPPSGAGSVEIKAPAISGTAPSTDSKSLLVASLEPLPTGLSANHPASIRVDFRIAGDPPAVNALPLSTELAPNRANDLTVVAPGQKPATLTVEPTALARVAPITAGLTQLGATTTLDPAVGAKALPDQIPTVSNINFQPTDLANYGSQPLRITAAASLTPAQKLEPVGNQAGAIISPLSKLALSSPTKSLSLGQLIETNSVLNQASLLASAGGVAPDASITQYHGPLAPSFLAADVSALSLASLPQSAPGIKIDALAADGSRTVLPVLGKPVIDLAQITARPLSSPYNVSFSQLDVATNTETRSVGSTASPLITLSQPPLQLALANRAPLGLTDSSLDALPLSTTVALRPTEPGAAATPLIVQSTLGSTATSFRPSTQELLTTPVILSASLTPNPVINLLAATSDTSMLPVPATPAVLAAATPNLLTGDRPTQLTNPTTAALIAPADIPLTGAPANPKIPRSSGLALGDLVTPGSENNYVTATALAANSFSTARDTTTLPATASSTEPSRSIAVAQYLPANLNYPLLTMASTNEISASTTVANNGLITAPLIQTASLNNSSLFVQPRSLIASGNDFITDLGTAPLAESVQSTSIRTSPFAQLKTIAQPPQEFAADPTPTKISLANAVVNPGDPLATTLPSTTRLAELATFSHQGDLQPPATQNLALGNFIQPDLTLRTIAPASTLTSGLQVSSDVMPGTVSLAPIKTANIPIDFGNLSAASAAPAIDLASLTQPSASVKIEGAKPFLVSQALGADQPNLPIVYNAPSLQPALYSQTRDAIALGTQPSALTVEQAQVLLPGTVFKTPAANGSSRTELLENSFATSRAPADVTAPTFVPNQLLANTTIVSTLPATDGSSLRLAEISVPPNLQNATTATNLALGAFVQPDVPTIKPTPLVVSANSPATPLVDTAYSAHSGQSVREVSLLSDASLTPAQPMIANSTVLRGENFNYGNAVSHDLTAALVSEPVPTLPQAKTALTFGGNSTIAALNVQQVAPSGDFVPNTVLLQPVASPGGNSVFRVADGGITTLPATQTNLLQPAFSTAGNSLSHTNDAALTPLPVAPTNLALGAFLQSDGSTVKTTPVLVAGGSTTATAIDGVSNLPVVAAAREALVLPDATYLTAASAGHPTAIGKTTEPIQLAATNLERTNFAAQGAFDAGNFVYDNSANRALTTTAIADPVPVIAEAKPAKVTIGNSINPPPIYSPVVAANDFIPSTVAIKSTANSTETNLFHVADAGVTPLNSTHETFVAAAVIQPDPALNKPSPYFAAANSSFATISDTTPLTNKEASNLSLGSLLPSESSGKPSGPLVFANSTAGAGLDATPAATGPAPLRSVLNLPAEGTYTAALPASQPIVPGKVAETVQVASLSPFNSPDQPNLAVHGAQLAQSFNYGNSGIRDFTTPSSADAVQVAQPAKSPVILAAGGASIANSYSPVASADVLPGAVKTTFSANGFSQVASNDFSSAAIPQVTTVNFRSSNGDLGNSPLSATTVVAQSDGTVITSSPLAPSMKDYTIIANATDNGALLSSRVASDLSRFAPTTTGTGSDLTATNSFRTANGALPGADTYASVADAQNLVAKMGQVAGRNTTNQDGVQTSGGYARLSTSAIGNTVALSSPDVHALSPTIPGSNLTSLASALPLDGSGKIAVGNAIVTNGQALVGPLSGASLLVAPALPGSMVAGPGIGVAIGPTEASKIVAAPSTDKVTTSALDASLLVGSRVLADNKVVGSALDQTLHPAVGVPTIGDLGVRPVSTNIASLDLSHPTALLPIGPGGLDPSIRAAVTVVKPLETDLTGVKTVIIGQIVTGRLPDGTALRPDPNGIIFSVKGAGAEVDPVGNRLLTINQRTDLIGTTTTTGVVGATTGIINGSINEINIIGLTSTRTVRIGSDAPVDSNHSTITGNLVNGNSASLPGTATGKGNPLVTGGASTDPLIAGSVTPGSTTATGSALPPNSAAGALVTPVGTGNPDEDKNNSGITAGTTVVVIGNTLIPLPNLEFFDGKLINTRLTTTGRTEQVVSDTLVHGALPPLTGMDQTVSDILAARNGKQDPGIPNFDSNLSPISVFADPKRFEPTGGVTSTRAGEENAEGKAPNAGHRVDLTTELGQTVDPKTQANSTKEVDQSNIDTTNGKKESGTKSEVEDGVTARPDASKVEDAEISDDVRNQITTLLTDQGENLTGVSDRRTVKDFIDELLHHTKRRTYRIDSGDTLEKLARRFLKDKRLAALIYLLNEDLLGNQADLSNIQLRAGQVLTMPSIEDVLQYRIHILHDVMPPHIYKNIIDNPDERIVGSSKLLRATYSCRLGDRLTSIAARHSALRDEKLWTLIAQLNGLSTTVDSNGRPKAVLKRAQKLILPSRKDIDDHFRKNNLGTPAKMPAQVPSPASQKLASESIESLGNVSEERATINWGDGSDLPTPLSAIAQKGADGLGLSIREIGPDSAAKSGGNDGPSSKGPKSKPRRIAPNEARIVAPEDLGEGSAEIYLRLEFEYEGKWLPVIEYTGTNEQIYLHVYTLAGRTDSIPIALPTRSIRELAECDLGANYQRYCQRFLAGDRPI